MDTTSPEGRVLHHQREHRCSLPVNVLGARPLEWPGGPLHLVYKYTVQQVKDFEENELMSSASHGLDTHNQDGDMKLEEIKAEVDPPTKLVMEKLGGVVQKSEVSQSVVNSPSAITTSEHVCSANIQRAIMVRAL